ncbi:MAG: DHHW family protein [Firmicutes bacterium]|nr:DHHW family protein [Bacillota bacterium]
MSEEKRKNRKGFCLTLPFLLVLAVLTAASFIIPLRPTFSESEKRELTRFPEFSVSALVSGDYFDEITLWFSDTFPGRETWIALSQRVSSFHGYSEVAIDGVLTDSDEIPADPGSDAPEPSALLPGEQTAPDESTSPEEITETGETTEPEEQQWGGAQVEGNEISLGAAIQIGDAGYNQFGFSQRQSDRYIASVSGFADRMAEKGVRVASAPAPTSVGVMIPPEYYEQLRCANQGEVIRYLHDNMSDSVIKVDTFSNLVKHNDEYIYFRTDHHWTALGAYYAYEAYCDAMGYEAAPLDSFTLWNQGDFAGSLYGKVRWPNRLTIDSMDCYVPRGDITMYAYFEGADKPTLWPLIADRTAESKNSRYSAFLASDRPMVHVINDSLPDAPSCLVVKDSFGNCYVPFLTQNYHHIYAIDYRKYNQKSVAELVEEYGIDDVIIMPYMIATQSTDGNDFFQKRLR